MSGWRPGSDSGPKWQYAIEPVVGCWSYW